MTSGNAKPSGATIDKSGWPKGPWMTEPDRVEWRSETGLPCLARRNQSGVWCGYAAMPPGHPWHGKGYDDVPAEAHGGLTYAGACSGEICHVPAPGEPDDVWWLGFDCAHYGDHIPAYDRSWLGTYRDLGYVRAEVENIARQAINAARPDTARTPQADPLPEQPARLGRGGAMSVHWMKAGPSDTGMELWILGGDTDAGE